MSDDRTPILIGAGQLTQRDVDPAAALEPLAMMVETARRAAADAGADDAAARAARLRRGGQHPRRGTTAMRRACWRNASVPGRRSRSTRTVGGNTPQWLVNEIAAQIAAGQRAAGADRRRRSGAARCSARAAAHTQLQLDDRRQPGEPTVIGETRQGTSDHEMNHGLQLPTGVYPLFENALRAHDGLSIAAHQRAARRAVRRLLGGRRAAIPTPGSSRQRSAAEIATVVAAEPLHRLPVPEVHERDHRRRPGGGGADDLGRRRRASSASIRRAGCICWGCGDAHDLWFVSRTRRTTTARRRSASPASRRSPWPASAIDDIDLLRSLQLLSQRRADRPRHARHCRRRSAAADGHRRPAVPRRPGQQLRDARDRDDDGPAARRAGHHGSGHRPRLVSHQALRRHLRHGAAARGRGRARTRRAIKPRSTRDAASRSWSTRAARPRA